MASVKSSVSIFLRQHGVIVRRSRYPTPRRTDVGAGELKALDGIIDRYLAETAGGRGWANRNTLRDYLHFTRLAFYHDALRLCREAGVDFADRDVADIGTGAGYLCRLIKEEYPTARVSGFDNDAGKLSFARAICKDAEFQACDLMEITSTFDVVFLMEVLEHLDEPEAVLGKILSLVRPNGWAVLTVPNGREDNFIHHVNFWSPESWQHFIRHNLPGGCQPSFAIAKNGNNFVAIRRM
jgi:2-polyprenyl-3-methyl-5-hydroxy-6-metoxy-1,4-benzoquinol methylase